MQRTMDETNRRREKQMRYNEENGITPTQIKKEISNALATDRKERIGKEQKMYSEDTCRIPVACDPIVEYMSAEQLKKSIERTRKLMEQAAEKMEFIEAAQYRDEMFKLQEILKGKET
jgi:excinuclease ABC subunit B